MVKAVVGDAKGIAGCGSFFVATTDSVVRSVDATLVAFWSADLVTFTGSRIPALTISQYSSVRALKPNPAWACCYCYSLLK